jgi:hypothetical protein
MITSTRSLGSAPLVVVGVGAAAGLVLTLTSRIAGLVPVSAFGVGVLVAAVLGATITRDAAEAAVPPATRRPARPGPSRPAQSLVNRGAERREQPTRYRGANQIGLTEWRLAPVALDDQDEEVRGSGAATRS